MTMELELSGYGPAAWRLSPAQVRARVEKLARMREAREVSAFDANVMSQASDQETVKAWLAARQ